MKSKFFIICKKAFHLHKNRPLNIFEMFVYQVEGNKINKVEGDLKDLGVTLNNVNITLNGN